MSRQEFDLSFVKYFALIKRNFLSGSFQFLLHFSLTILQLSKQVFYKLFPKMFHRFLHRSFNFSKCIVIWVSDLSESFFLLLEFSFQFLNNTDLSESFFLLPEFSFQFLNNTDLSEFIDLFISNIFSVDNFRQLIANTSQLP